MALGARWGATAEEMAAHYPCDDRCPSPDARYFRAATAAAGPALLFRWLCQLRAAPYSYDAIDNGGRRSPQELTPGLERLAVGQTVMTLFELRAFEPDRSITIVNKDRGGARRLFGEVWVSYVVKPAGAHASRLLAKVLVRYPTGLRGALLRAFLPLGDLIMMRRQLLNLAALAARDEARRTSS